jgi:plastocyanin
MRLVRLIAATALAAAVAVPLTGSSAAAEAQPARIVDFEFAPSALTVRVGSAVEWTNAGKRPHTVTDRGGTFDTDAIAPGTKKSITFSVPGRYAVFCRINPTRMNAVVTVEGDAANAPVNRIQATDPAREGDVLRFDPAELTVKSGSTLLLANIGGKPHTLTADDGSFDTGVVTPGAEGGRFAGSNATVTLTKPGTFAFHCEVHPQAMKGTLTVTGEAAREPPPPAASAAPSQVAVDMRGIAFRPPEISVAPGGQVTWTNRDSAPHDADFDDIDLKTDLIDRGETTSVKAPTEPGSYSYFCSVHPNMRAVLAGGRVGGVLAAGKVSLPGRVAAGAGDGPGGGVTALALATAVAGSFLGGFGISAFARRRPANP